MEVTHEHILEHLKADKAIVAAIAEEEQKKIESKQHEAIECSGTGLPEKAGNSQ